MPTTLLGRYCPNCDFTYFSRARHDFRPCPCWIESGTKDGGYVDGGRDYLKCGGKGIIVRVTVDQSEQELALDWKNGTEQFGLIKGNVGIPIGEKNEK